MGKILLVNNDAEILGMMEQLLEREGYEVWKARTAQAALSMVSGNPPDLCVIEADLPGFDGVALCRKLRSYPETSNIPIIVLTDADSLYSVADILEAGGDDSLRKPFAQRELAARIRAQLRRASFYAGDGDLPVLQLQPDSCSVSVNGRQVMLTQVEFDLLRYLCRTPQQMHTTADLLTNVWQYPHGTGDAALVRNHVRNLRRKIEDDSEHPTIIQSRHGRGYVIRAHIQTEERAAAR